MFDIGWSELLVIAVVALIAIGPKELPGVLRSVGYWMGKVRRMAAEFQGQFQEAMREAEMADLKKHADDLNAAAKSLTKFDPVSYLDNEIKSATAETTPPAATPAAETPAVETSATASDAAATPASVEEAAPAAAEIAAPPSIQTIPPPEPEAVAVPSSACARCAGGRMTQEDIDATKAPLMDHLIELRSRLIKALIAFAIAFVACFFFAKQIYNILVWPFVLVAGPENSKFIYTALLEYFITQLKLAMFGAAFLSFPVVATQIYKFVAPGLYRHERGAFLPYLIATPIFFVMGALVVYFVVMPMLVRFSLGMQQTPAMATPRSRCCPKSANISR